jgi:anaerobic ribonucleoside-triphosphate reductase activating protein
MTTLSISRLHFPVTTLGPGKRLGLWVQGCSRHCPACLDPSSWPFTSKGVKTKNIFNTIRPILSICDGLTISGGEPFEQPQALIEFTSLFKSENQNDILIFTGFLFNELSFWLKHTNHNIDALICGPYEKESSQTLALRGSDNQTLNFLTPLGQQKFSNYERKLLPDEKSLDLMFEDNGDVWLAGIPRSGDLEKLKEIWPSAPSL